MNFTSWLPKLGALLGILGGAMTASFLGGLGAPHFFGWCGAFATMVGVGVVGMTARQDNKSSEQVGAGNVPPDPAKVGKAAGPILQFGGVDISGASADEIRALMFKAFGGEAAKPATTAGVTNPDGTTNVVKVTT